MLFSSGVPELACSMISMALYGFIQSSSKNSSSQIL